MIISAVFVLTMVGANYTLVVCGSIVTNFLKALLISSVGVTTGQYSEEIPNEMGRVVLVGKEP